MRTLLLIIQDPADLSDILLMTYNVNASAAPMEMHSSTPPRAPDAWGLHDEADFSFFLKHLSHLSA